MVLSWYAVEAHEMESLGPTDGDKEIMPVCEDQWGVCTCAVRNGRTLLASANVPLHSLEPEKLVLPSLPGTPKLIWLATGPASMSAKVQDMCMMLLPLTARGWQTQWPWVVRKQDIT